MSAAEYPSKRDTPLTARRSAQASSSETRSGSARTRPANKRGKPKYRKDVTAEKPRVRRIGSLVSQLMSRRGYAQVAVGEEMRHSLVAAVGESLAQSCRIGNLRAGVLQIYASDSVTLQELTFRQRPILRQLQKDFADGKVTALRFRMQSET